MTAQGLQGRPAVDPHVAQRRLQLGLWCGVLATTAAGEAIVAWQHVSYPGTTLYPYWLEPLVGVAVLLTVGVVLSLRRPDHTVTRLLLLDGILGSLQTLSGAYAAMITSARPGLPFGPLATLVSFEAQLLTIVTLLLLVAVFPTGRPLTPRWRWPLAALAVGALANVVNQALVPTFTVTENPTDVVVNPYGLPEGHPVLAVTGALMLLLAPGILAAIVSPFVRYRRASGLQRLQLRWLAFGTLAVPPVLMLARGPFAAIAWGIGPTLPVFCAGLAILRYRLFEIDRIIRRTITWTLVTGLLLAVYLFLTLGVAQMLGPDDAPDLVVAGATLAVAALFRPARQRVQTLVDRRFHRRRADAEAAVARYAEQVRTDVALASLTDDLAVAVRTAMAPSTLAVWLAPDTHGAPSRATANVS